MANKFTHKFVNAGVKGKLTPSLFAARKSITATNRIGNTVASIGNVVWDMRQIAVKSAANKVLAEQAQRRREQRERDAEAEEAAELDKSLQKDGKAAKPTSQQKGLGKKHFGWLNGFLRPIVEFFGWLIKVTLIKKILSWLGDPKNKTALKEFLVKFTFVVKKLYSFVSWIVKDNILDGFADLMGAGGKDGKDSFWDRVRGLGKLMFGLTMMRWLLNPFAAVTDIIGLLDFIMNWRLPTLRIKGLKRLWGRRIKKGFNALRESKRLKKMVATIKKFGRPIMKPIRFIGKQWQNFTKGLKGADKAADIAKTTKKLFPHIADGSKKGGKAYEIGKTIRNLGTKLFGPGTKGGGILKALDFRNFRIPKPMKPKAFGNKMNKRWKDITTNIGNGFNTMKKWGSNGWDYLSKIPKKAMQPVYDRFLKPVWNKVKGVKKWVDKIASPMGNMWKQSPVGKMARGVGSKKVAGQRLKNIPIIGGLVNLYFAVDSFKNGDITGGVLESLAGVLELASPFTAGTTGVAGMFLDAYILARMIPGGIGETVMEWERTKAIPAIAGPFEGAMNFTRSKMDETKDLISKSFDGINKWIGAEKEADKAKHITEAAGSGSGMTKQEADEAYEKDKTGGRGWGFLKLFRNKSQTDKQVRKDVKKYGYTMPSGSFSAGSSHTDTTSRHSTGSSKDQPVTKKPWWKVWQYGGRQAVPSQGLAGGSFIFGGIGKMIGGFVGGIGKAIGGVIGGIGKVLGSAFSMVKNVFNSPLGQILMMALPVMFPAAAWLGPVLKGLNAVTSLMNGDPLGAIMSLSGAFSSINTVNAISMPKWMQNMRFSKFGNFMANLNGPGGFLSSKIGKIGVGILSGNYGAAFNAALDGTSLGATLANLGNKVDELGLGGVLGAIPGLGPTLQNMGLGDVVGISSLLTGDFSAAGFVTAMAEKHGYGGIVKAALGMAGGNFEQGMIDMAGELGVDPAVFGVIDTLQMLGPGGESERQKIMQEIGSISVVQLPIVLKQLVNLPTPVAVQSGGGGSSGGGGGLLGRLGF